MTMHNRTIRAVFGVLLTLGIVFVASAPALATEPTPSLNDTILVGDLVGPDSKGVVNVGVSFEDPDNAPKDHVVAFQRRVDNGWVTEGEPVNLDDSIVHFRATLEPGAVETFRVIRTHLGDGEPETLDTFPDIHRPDTAVVTPAPTQTATPPSRPSAEDVRDASQAVLDRLREQQAAEKSATPNPGATEEVAATQSPTSTPSPTSSPIVTGPVVETDIPGPQGPSVAELIGSIVALALGLGIVALQASKWGVKR